MTRTVAIIQARMGSRRLPGKVLTDIGDGTVLSYLARRLRDARKLDAICIATSKLTEDDPVADAAAELADFCVRGPADDVLGRYALAAEHTAADRIVRITADCPFVDPAIVDAAVALSVESGAEYCSNVMKRSYPDGLDVEVFTRDALLRCEQECLDPALREHVTPYMRTGHYANRKTGTFSLAHLTASCDFSHLRWTLDTEEDLGFVRAVVEAIRPDFSWLDLVALLTRQPHLLSWNRSKRFRIGALAAQDQAAERGSLESRYAISDEIFDRVIKNVPLASQTFSKSHFQIVRGAGPLFMDRGYGARCWDVDGNGYVDYVMGLLPVVLGHCDPDVDAAIIRQMERGQTLSLPTPIEGELADVLIAEIPSAEMVRFGKNGSDVTSAAIRLARAHTGRERVLVAGYHGWHDWYIGTTTRDLGVPQAVAALTKKIPFNDLDRAAEEIRKGDVAAIILEPAGAVDPADGYLEGLRDLTFQHGTVLIFDEIVTGFRVDMGGAQKLFGVTPDLSTFGKAIANGMPLSAVVGSKAIMQHMDDIFFSGTFGGECLSLAAALATIRKLKSSNAVARMKAFGRDISAALNLVIAEAGLSDYLRFEGADWWPRVAVKTPAGLDANLFKSLMRQEMHAHGVFFASSLNLSLSHCQPDIRDETIQGFRAAFFALADHIAATNPDSRLRGIQLQPTFAVRS